VQVLGVWRFDQPDAEHDDLDGRLSCPRPRAGPVSTTREGRVEETKRHMPSSPSVSANERPSRTAWMGLSAPNTCGDGSTPNDALTFVNGLRQEHSLHRVRHSGTPTTGGAPAVVVCDDGAVIPELRPSSRVRSTSERPKKEPAMPTVTARHWDHPVGSTCGPPTWRAAAGLRELFGWKAQEPSPEFGGYFMFTRDGVPVAGCMARWATSQPTTAEGLLASDDIERTVKSAVSAGAEIMFPTMAVADLASSRSSSIRPARPSAFGSAGPFLASQF